jgi:hypothetical protein
MKRLSDVTLRPIIECNNLAGEIEVIHDDFNSMSSDGLEHKYNTCSFRLAVAQKIVLFMESKKIL